VILPDANVLIYAVWPDSIDHRAYRDWLERVVGADEAYAMSPQVLSSVTRILTNRKAFPGPYTVDKVLDYANTLLNRPQCQIVQPGPRHWRIFCDLSRRANAVGNIVQDAWFAALAIEWGCEWITTDRDYARFPGLRWRTPF